MDTPLLIRLAQKNKEPSQLERQACLALAGLGQVISCRQSTTWPEPETNIIIVDFLADGESFHITLLPKGKGYWEWEILSDGDHGTYVSLSCAPLIVDKLTGGARINRLALAEWKRQWAWNYDMGQSVTVYALASGLGDFYSLQSKPDEDGYWPVIASSYGYHSTNRVTTLGQPLLIKEQVYRCTAALPDVLIASDYIGADYPLKKPIPAIAALLGLPRP